MKKDGEQFIPGSLIYHSHGLPTPITDSSSLFSCQKINSSGRDSYTGKQSSSTTAIFSSCNNESENVVSNYEHHFFKDSGVNQMLPANYPTYKFYNQNASLPPTNDDRKCNRDGIRAYNYRRSHQLYGIYDSDFNRNQVANTKSQVNNKYYSSNPSLHPQNDNDFYQYSHHQFSNTATQNVQHPHQSYECTWRDANASDAVEFHQP